MDDPKIPVDPRLRALLNASERVRFGPGVIGRSSVILVGVLALWGLVLWRLPSEAPWWATLIVLVGGATGVTAFISRQLGSLRAFAAANPDLALNEGGEIVRLRQIAARQKGSDVLDASPIVAGASLTALAPVVAIGRRTGRFLPQEPASGSSGPINAASDQISQSDK